VSRKKHAHDVYCLIRAAVQGPESLRDLLREKPDLVSARTSVGETALHYLAIENQSAAVRALARHGANVNDPDDFGRCGCPPSEPGQRVILGRGSSPEEVGDPRSPRGAWHRGRRPLTNRRGWRAVAPTTRCDGHCRLIRTPWTSTSLSCDESRS
jgi:hypothetical protein